MSWRMATSLEVLLGEIDDARPDRLKISDGGIGDADHATRDSDHNPWVIVNGVGVVRARDFTHDPVGGLDCQQLAEALAGLYFRGHPALGSGAYTIWRSRILSRDRLGEGWRPYGGSNPHDHHLHQSVALARSGFDSAAPWGVMEGIDMALDQDDVTRIARAVWNQKLLAEGGDKTRAGRLLVQTHKRADVGARLRAIENDAERIEGDLADVATRRQVQRLREAVRALRTAVEDDAGHGEGDGGAES